MAEFVRMSDMTAGSNYSLVTSDSLAERAGNKSIVEQEHAAWAATIEPHTETNPAIGVAAPEDSLGLDVVAVDSIVEHADAQKLRLIGELISPIASQTIEAFKNNENAPVLEDFSKVFRRKRSRNEVGTALVLDHRSLIYTAVGAASFVAALYELDLFEPGDIDLHIVVSAMLKHTTIYEGDILNGLTDGAFQRVQFVYPRTSSVSNSSTLSHLRDPFNTASGRADLERMRKNEKDLRAISPSGRADRLVCDANGERYHIAPFEASAKLLKRFNNVVVGLGEREGAPELFVDKQIHPAGSVRGRQSAHRLGARLATGMTLESGIPSIYHRSHRSFLRATAPQGVESAPSSVIVSTPAVS